MKTNLLVIDTSGETNAARLETLCEKLSADHYVYVMRPGSKFREDSPAGVRFIGNPISSPPLFGNLDHAVAFVGDDEYDLLVDALPNMEVHHLHSGSLVSLTAATIRRMLEGAVEERVGVTARKPAA